MRKSIWIVLACLVCSSVLAELSDEQILKQVRKEFPNQEIGEYMSRLARVTDGRKPNRRTYLLVFSDHNGDATHLVGFDPGKNRINLVDDKKSASDPRNKQFFGVNDFRRGMHVVRMKKRSVIRLTAKRDLVKGEPIPVDMRYLYKGKLRGGGKYRDLKFSMRFENDKWGLIHNNKKLSKIHFVVNKRFGMVIGIKRVQIE